MSNVITGQVRRRKVGSPTRKAVLMFMADCASDDGSGIWTSKSNMAADLEMGRRTVQNSIDDLAADGLISVAGHRKCKNGFTVEYRINLDAVLMLEKTRASGVTRAGDAHVEPVQEVHTCSTDTPRRAERAPQDVQDVHINHPRTILEPSNARDVLLSILRADTVDAFLELRKAKRSPMTVKAAELIVKKLAGHAAPDAVVERSIESGWTGVFPDKVQGAKPPVQIPKNQTGLPNPFEIVR